MPRNETTEARIMRLIDTRFVILTKGGSPNHGEISWIAYVEAELEQYEITFPNGSLRPVFANEEYSSIARIYKRLAEKDSLANPGTYIDPQG